MIIMTYMPYVLQLLLLKNLDIRDLIYFEMSLVRHASYAPKKASARSNNI
jgi:hypothetical protein